MHLVKNLMVTLSELLSDPYRHSSCKYELCLRIRISIYIGPGIATGKMSFAFFRIIFLCKDQFRISCLAESHATVARG